MVPALDLLDGHEDGRVVLAAHFNVDHRGGASPSIEWCGGVSNMSPDLPEGGGATPYAMAP